MALSVNASVSISLSSGFSFQAKSVKSVASVMLVSISLSSGFSFQVNSQGEANVYPGVSISLSSGFSFQDTDDFRRTRPEHISFNLVIERLLISGSKL